MMIHKAEKLAGLRDQIRQIEGIGEAAGHPVLPFGIESIDRALPDRGLPLGGMHEVRGPSQRGRDGAATGFCAALLARLQVQDDRPALWLERGDDLYLPGLTRYGLKAGKVLTVSHVVKDADMLWAMEEALSSGAVCAVVGEVRAADFTASRRLQLAAETGGVTGFMLSEGGMPGAATALTRWQVGAEPSLATDLPGVGTVAWRVDLLKARNGQPASWTVACEGLRWDGFENRQNVQPDLPLAIPLALPLAGAA